MPSFHIYRNNIPDQVGLLLAVRGNHPLFFFIQIREPGICLVSKIDLRNMCNVALIQKLLVNALAADDIDISLGYFFSSSCNSSISCTMTAPSA